MSTLTQRRKRDQTVRLAIVGCGAVSQLYYAPALRELARHGFLRVTALYDPDADNAERLAQSFPQAERVGDLADLSPSKVDLAIIASPPRYHASQTIDLLSAGLSVLCEKPMATSVKEAASMIDAAATARGVFAVGLFRRFFPATQFIHQIVSQGLLGDVTEVDISEGDAFMWPVHSPSYFKRATSNGGVLMDIGPHTFDLLVWWFGEPGAVYYEDDAMGGIEANCRIQIRFENGMEGRIRLSRDCQLANRYLIHGTRGRLSWNANDAEHVQMSFNGVTYALNARLHALGSSQALSPLGPPAYTFQQSFMAQLRNVIAALHGDEAIAVPGSEGIRSLRLIEQCYRGRMPMPLPWLSPSEQQRATQLHRGRRSEHAASSGHEDLTRR